MAFHELTVSAVRPVAEDAVAVSFHVPETLSETFSYRPGQFLTLRADVGGQDIRRSYSIAALPGDPLTVGIRAVPGGTFSEFAQELSAGIPLRVMAPEGRFCPKEEQDLLLIAAGSGITPMMSIAGDALARGARVTLVYGNRTLASIMFRDLIDAMKDQHLNRFRVIHVLSRERQDVELLNGRVDGEKVSVLAEKGLIAPLEADGVFLCGPGEMIDDLRDMFERMGVAPDRLHIERFTSDGRPAAPRSRAAKEVARTGVTVDVVLDGSHRQFSFTDEDENLVAAAERQGLELPYSCRGGMCCTCRCRISEGAAEMAVNYSLQPWEIEAGFTLACQSRPTTGTLSIDFDAA